jgi:hypothetical protein
MHFSASNFCQCSCCRFVRFINPGSAIWPNFFDYKILQSIRSLRVGFWDPFEWSIVQKYVARASLEHFGQRKSFQVQSWKSVSVM